EGAAAAREEEAEAAVGRDPYHRGLVVRLLSLSVPLPEGAPRGAIDDDQTPIEGADRQVRLSVSGQLDDRGRRDHPFLPGLDQPLDALRERAVQERGDGRAVRGTPVGL